MQFVSEYFVGNFILKLQVRDYFFAHSKWFQALLFNITNSKIIFSHVSNLHSAKRFQVNNNNNNLS